MNGIISFFRKHHFTVFFLLLEMVAFYCIFNFNLYHRAIIFNLTTAISGTVDKAYSEVTSYFELQAASRQLADENAQLRNVMARIYDTIAGNKQAIRNTTGEEYDYTMAEVIDNTTSQTDNYLMLNKGKMEGISEGEGVISPAGIAGIVVGVSIHYSIVMSVLHSRCIVSAMLKRGGAFGTLSWNDNIGYRYALLSQIPMSEKIKPGDTVLTSGYSSIFPKGIPIGTVDKYSTLITQYFYSIRVRLFTDFKTLQYAYLVRDIKKDEKKTLEEQEEKHLNTPHK